MATLNLTITEKTEPDFDGNNETVKQVKCDIDGMKLTRQFAYPVAMADATITTDVRAKLAADGFIFD